MRVLVTGANGFIGRQLCATLADAGYVVRAGLRTSRELPPGATECAVSGDIGADTRWEEALDRVELVVHAAARAHVTESGADDEGEYLETNTHGTRRLVQAAARCGVRRFVLLSSVKVNGPGGAPRAYAAHDAPRPADAYGRSKWLAEQALWQAVADGAMQAVVVRPPLVYGPGVRANFLRLLRWVDAERVLPLAAVANQRSLVSVWTLCDLIGLLLTHPAAPGGTWMVSDGTDISSPDLVRRMAALLGRRPRLVAVPVGVLRLAGGLLGRGAEVRRLCESLTVDTEDTCARLGWTPLLGLEAALARTVDWYRATARGGTP